MGNVLETQKIAMPDETRITKKEFRVSLFTEGIEQVINTNLNKNCNKKRCIQYFLKKEIIQ